MGKKRQGKNKFCEACQKEFYVPTYRIETAKFCSIECQNHKQYERYFFECKNCKKSCESSPSRRNYNKKFCSLECKNAKKQSEKERRSNTRAYNNKVRGFSSSRQLRRWIWEFKEKRCEVCGFDEYDFCLDIHHIDENPQNNDLENLVILCVICHRKHHKGMKK